MTSVTIYGLDDLEGAFDRDAIKRGDLCESTGVLSAELVLRRPRFYRRKHADPTWANVALTAGCIMLFIALVGAMTIGGVSWLDSWLGR